MMDFDDFLEAFDEDEFEETPVDLETFLYSKEFLAGPRLSKIQKKIVEVGTQIYKEHTLKKLYGEEEGTRLWKQTKKELLLCLGKGSGKDYLSSIICVRIVYLLMCLKSPQHYFGKPPGDNIDIVNVAINAKQAQNVFFKALKARVKQCAWFNGKYHIRADDISFPKEIYVHSLHSERESTEGYNIMVAVLDEIDGFDETAPPDGEGKHKSDKMYATLQATVTSRYDDIGKVVMLSFPRSRDGFMLRKWKEFVVEKNVFHKEHTFKLNKELPDGYENNEYTINWKEEEATYYRYDNVWALKLPTWEVNPTKNIDMFVMDFQPARFAESMARFACCPPDFTSGGWYRDKARIDATFRNPNGVTEDGSVRLKPNPDTMYYAHVDLALKHDNCAVAVSHIEKMVQINMGGNLTAPEPYVIVDLVHYWKPGADRSLDFSEVREFIISLQRLGFNLGMVSFDQWHSEESIQKLNDVGIKSEKYSVGREQYQEFSLIMGENRLEGPDSDLLKSELKQLIVTDRGKVEHTSKSGKDLSDAVCGSISNSIRFADNFGFDNEIVDMSDIIRPVSKPLREPQAAPRPELPAELEFFVVGL